MFRQARYVIVGSVCAAIGLFALLSEDYWRDRWIAETSSTIVTPEGEQHVGFVRHNNKLLVESYSPSTNTCYLRDVETDNLHVKVEQCNYVVLEP